ncbi:hypothetical protein MtrunA17_Chr6g0452951 [Medicago truncatula]|uniref:Transmembrane protein n=1 Tax=Medicago truncatula TaxID=3880 RepID=A0A396HDY3_MEDTR|nr:hypothetical protein MtrunA17_Chr6g0452951 [Medicago truncatula]
MKYIKAKDSARASLCMHNHLLQCSTNTRGPLCLSLFLTPPTFSFFFYYFVVKH